MRYAVPAALAAMLVVLASGCARPEHVNPANRALSTPSSASLSASSEPAVADVPRPSAPTAPPNGPTDQNKPTGWIVGTVTAGGTGPCYGLETDDGVQYALHSTAGTRLDRGARVRVKGTPSRLRINCGPGKLLDMTVAEPLR
ncbi:hypothetical protein ACIA5D_29715 [Actinoplanes sp. NPDC051513]|uniref:hypothetical protein n=1 Tax=Actinoplanes sp. NPDC051513 TaxID=3363908 RepID=UPI0037B1EA92